LRILVVGAGAVGGYFGGRLLEAKRDVTFLVRPKRAAELANQGLRLHSPLGDILLSNPVFTQAESLGEPFDLVLLSCKAYDLLGAMVAVTPAVGPNTAVLPLLNGMRHMDILKARFGSALLGGRCLITATLNEHREVVHFAPIHTLTFGELDGTKSRRIESIQQQLSGAQFDAQLSENILLDMWEKWVFIASAAGSTCLMRASIGDICASPEGRGFILRLLDECRTIAAANGFALRAPFLDRCREMLTTPGSPMKASMLRDLEAGGPTESDHILGDLLARDPGDSPLLRAAYAHLKTYESRLPVKA
jgi:2-dehydropantoate 2-reductase